MDMERRLLSEAKMEKEYGPVIKTDAYLKNRSLTNTIVRKQPTTKYLKMYGSKDFIKIPEIRRRSKLGKIAEVGISFGYTDIGY